LPKGGGLCQAALEAFDLHANVWVPGRDRAQREWLWLGAPAVPNAGATQASADERVLIELAQTRQWLVRTV